MFQEVLRSVVDNTEGGIAALLMGYDGIPVEQYLAQDQESNVETVGMEYSVILKEIRKAAEMLDAGDAREVAIQAENVTTLIRMLNSEYFVAMTIKPGGNFGKARYLLRVNSQKLIDALS
ncbi:MAG: hypothetical protein IPK60_18880 [Sandaracinaceae bacterium]|nr:hypothetical protein [Sandaracinaceae bacterium]